MEDTVWSTMPDTCISLCKYSSPQELTSLWNAIFQFSKLLVQFCFRITKRAKQMQHRRTMDVLPSFPNQGLHGPAGPGRSCLPKRHCDTWQLPTNILPLDKAPTEFQTLLDWTPRLPLSALHPGSCAKFCCSLAYLFASVYSRQQSRSALNDIQKCKFCSPWQSYQLEQSALEHYGVWGRSRVWAPCLVTPNWSLLKSEEVFHYFQLSVDPFKPESQYLLNTAFHTWTLCKAEQKEYAIYKHVEASIMKFFMFL